VPADTADSREARGGEKSGKARGWRERGEIERGRGRKDVRQELTRVREGRRQRADASYHDAQGATPRASLEGEREKVEGAGEDATAGVAKTLIRSSSHVAPFL